jgi:hypothetical protein
LKERSFATAPLESRDLTPTCQVIIDDGTTQDLLYYLKSVQHDACLVTIDFAGLTTRSKDIIKLIGSNPSLKMTVIEPFAQYNQVFIFDTETLVEDTASLQKFEDRKYFIQRSK